MIVSLTNLVAILLDLLFFHFGDTFDDLFWCNFFEFKWCLLFRDELANNGLYSCHLGPSYSFPLLQLGLFSYSGKMEFHFLSNCLRIGEGVRVDIKTINDYGFRFTSHRSVQYSPSLFDVTTAFLQLLAKIAVSFSFHFNTNFSSNLLMFKVTP